jgi:hypothetical protein
MTPSSTATSPQSEAERRCAEMLAKIRATIATTKAIRAEIEPALAKAAAVADELTRRDEAKKADYLRRLSAPSGPAPATQQPATQQQKGN